MSDSEKPKSWRERRQSIKHKWAIPFVYVEWKCEQLSELLEQWAFLDILGYAGRLAILVALISYIIGGPSRQKAKHYQAWQVINLAQGKSGSGGRKKALEDLHKDGISLAGVDVSKAYLPELNLKNADLVGADFSETYLQNANLSGAKLYEANLTDAELRGTNLIGASFSDANLTGTNLSGVNLTEVDFSDANLPGAYLIHSNLAEANLSGANLTEATLYGTNLTGAYLSDANLAGAKLYKANLAEANLFRANLTEATLTDANLAEANLIYANLKSIKQWKKIKGIEHANIYGVLNPPEGFIEWAKEHGVVSIDDEGEWDKLILKKKQELKQQK